MGKHKPIYVPHLNTGDYVVVINAEKVRVTGNKLKQKIYYRHSGFPGGITETTAGRLLETRPEQVIEKAVVGMLPPGRLGRKLALKLKIYAGEEHPHVAQAPEQLPA